MDPKEEKTRLEYWISASVLTFIALIIASVGMAVGNMTILLTGAALLGAIAIGSCLAGATQKVNRLKEIQKAEPGYFKSIAKDTGLSILSPILGIAAIFGFYQLSEMPDAKPIMNAITITLVGGVVLAGLYRVTFGREKTRKPQQ